MLLFHLSSMVRILVIVVMIVVVVLVVVVVAIFVVVVANTRTAHPIYVMYNKT